MDVSQYLDMFLDETKEHIQNLSDQIMRLEENPEDADTINEIFRAAHTLKGIAGTMGFTRMQKSLCKYGKCFVHFTSLVIFSAHKCLRLF